MKPHSLAPVVRILFATMMLFALVGCQRTVFQNPPSAAEACDPALVGRWLSQGDKDEQDGELEALVDAKCRLVTIEHKQSGERRSEPTTLSTARVGGVRYLWLEATWANRSFEVEPNLLDRDGDIYLFAYSLSRNRLRLANAPNRALAHRVLDKDIAGEVLMRENELTVRISGTPDEIRKTLGKHRVFRFDEPLQFRRAASDDAP